MLIRTKIIATIGPASGSVERMSSLVKAGCDVFRVNFSHGSDEQHEEFLRNIRAVEEELSHPLAVLADLCGPKIRVGSIGGGSVLLVEGQEIVIQREAIEGTVKRISTTLGELIDTARVGESILMDDGKLHLEVIETRQPVEIVCRVVVGGMLSSGKGINLPQTDLTLSALTEKDRSDAAWIAQRDFDYVALSFVRRAQDVIELRKLLVDAGSEAQIVAKIEKPQAVENIDSIIEASDAIMVARGDLGVEMALPAVPVAQKRIARLCQKAGKCCIIATQMLESMTDCPTPTRAEVSDVANAVLDFTDAVMLSGETAVGKYPVRAVKVMDDVVANMQVYHDEHMSALPVEYKPSATVAALAAAVGDIVAAESVAAVAVFTLSGSTARVLSKSRLNCPILALAPEMPIVRRMSLYYGVQGVQVPILAHTQEILDVASKYAVENDIAKPGQKIVVISGRPIGKPGMTNTLVVHTVK